MFEIFILEYSSEKMWGRYLAIVAAVAVLLLIFSNWKFEIFFYANSLASLSIVKNRNSSKRKKALTNKSMITDSVSEVLKLDQFITKSGGSSR